MKRFFVLLLCVMMLITCLPASAAGTKGEDETRKTVPLLSCDTVDGWKSEAEIMLDSEDKTEGEACVSFTTSIPKDGDGTLSIEAVFAPINILGADFLSFDFYISDPELLRATYIMTVDLSSSGNADAELLDWPADVFHSVNEPGWYHVELPFSEALSLGFNDSHVRYFRLFFFHINPQEDLTDVEIKIDNLKVEIPTYRTTMVESCDTADGWTGGNDPYAPGPTIDRAVKKEGQGSLFYKVSLPQQVHLVSQKVYGTPFNVKGASHVEMDVYVSDINALKNCRYAVQFEITSSGICDQQELSWSLDKYITKNGWTHIRLPISDASPCNGNDPALKGPLDLSRVNYFRFHTLDLFDVSGNQFIFRVDNIAFSFPAEPQNLFYGATPIVRDEDSGEGDAGEGDVGNGDELLPPVPNIPGPDDTTDKNKEKELRARQTQQRAKVLILLMAFVIIGVDIVAVALRRKAEEKPLTAEGEVPPDTEG